MTLNCVFYTIYPPPPHWRVSVPCRENQWMRTSSDVRVTLYRTICHNLCCWVVWCDLISWHLSAFMRAAKIATMGWARSWELKVHPLTAACCHIVRLKVQTSPDSRLETHLDSSLWDYGGKRWPSGGTFFIPDWCGQSFTNDHRLVA